jgi:hypothetical protein
MKRADAIHAIRIAGYHEDKKRAMRVMIENRVSREAYDTAFIVGRKQRAGGMKCACPDCNGTERAS